MVTANVLFGFLAGAVPALIALASMVRWVYREGRKAGKEDVRRENEQRVHAETQVEIRLLSAAVATLEGKLAGLQEKLAALQDRLDSIQPRRRRAV
jgi:uncharacterized coiled-coil protein SlyX